MRGSRVFLGATIAILTACSSSSSDSGAQQPDAGNAGAAGMDSGGGADSSAADAEVEAESGQDASVDQAPDACTQPSEPEPNACDLEKQDCACGRCVLYRKETDGVPMRLNRRA